MVDSSKTELDQESSRVLCFLRRIFKEELGDHHDHDSRKPMLLGLTIRAALLDSGFVETAPVSNSTTGNVQRNWYLPTFYYTVSDIITSGRTETIKIKFQHLGTRYCRVYGWLVDGTTVHSMLLDKARLALYSAVVWANCQRVIVVMKATNKATKIEPKKEVLKYWRNIKDELVLPLLTDLCEKAGLQPPTGLMQLPDELQLKILESVCGNDLARLSCVNSKLRSLASNDELWKRKFAEQSPCITYVGGDWTFKQVFASFSKVR